MKKSAVIVSVIGLSLAGVVQAQSMRDLPVVFDNYQVMPEVSLVPKSLASSSRIGELQDQAAVGNPAPSSQIVNPGTVLRNRASGNIAVATGSVAVMTEAGSNIYELADAYGLTVARSVPEINMYVLEAGKNQNLLDIRKRLQAESSVKSVKLDIKEDRQKPM